MTANDNRQTVSRRIFIMDHNSKLQFLIDTGSDLCVFPRDLLPGSPEKSCYELVPANRIAIATMTLNLGFRRNYTWRFVVADVSKPVIGVDFLAYYDLLVDVENRELCDATTRLSARGSAVTEKTSSVKSVMCSSLFHGLLMQFLDITRPGGVATVKHKTVHFIKTSPGPAVAHRLHCLAPHKLQAARKEFDAMLKLGIARPSESSWSSPLHMVPKKNNEWRPCGDFQGLNARAVPDHYPVRHIQDFSQKISGKTVYSTIDLVKAFHQIPVAEEDICKSVTTTPFGMFEFPFVTFELRNAAQTFKRFIYSLQASTGLRCSNKPGKVHFWSIKCEVSLLPRQLQWYITITGQSGGNSKLQSNNSGSF